MRKILVVILLLLAYSAYFFPFTLRAFPIMNSKMMMALLGLCMFVYTRLCNKNMTLRTDLLWMMVLATMVSLWSFFSITYNNTNDYAYVGYFMSMATWLGGAYACVTLTRTLNEEASIYSIFQYLALMCAGHCVLALMIDNIQFVKEIIDSIFFTDAETMTRLGRLYSFGVSFDTAGIRFSPVLVGLAYLIRGKKSSKQFWHYISLYVIIAGIGCVISRTTLVGVSISLLYMAFTSTSFIFFVKYRTIFWLLGLAIAVVLVGSVVTYLYNTNESVYSYLRYGFEGFFNYFEHGEWETYSSNLLFNGLEQLPTEQKTWIIGDGYFDDPLVPGAFYMGVDMGYVRFIYYFGLIGLGIFIFYFMYCTYVLCQRDSKRRLFFVMMFLLELGVWVKITTDIFCMFALLMLLTKEETDSDNKPLNPII